MRSSVLKAMSRKFLAFSFILALGTISGLAQVGTSGVSGIVKDQNGAGVAGATVTLSNPATAFFKVGRDEWGRGIRICGHSPRNIST